MGSSDSGSTNSTIRYAPYVESAHAAFLDTVASRRAVAIDNSPYSGYTDIEIDDAFFGASYTIASFPSLYDMYGKFMAGLDVDVLYDQIYDDTLSGAAINNLVSAEAAMMDDDIEANVLPRFKTGMRDINSVMSSSFVTGAALIEDARVKALSKFSTGLKFQMIPIATDRWKTHLDWNKGVVVLYSEIIKLYYSAKMDIVDFNYTKAAQNTLWPFTVLEYERAALGALQGAMTTTSETKQKKGGWGEVLSSVIGIVGIAAMFASDIRFKTDVEYL